MIWFSLGFYLKPKYEKIDFRFPSGLWNENFINLCGSWRCRMCQIAPMKYGRYLVYNSKVAYDAYVYSAGTTNNENIDVVLEYYLCFNNWSLCSDVPDWVKEFGSCVKISMY